MRLTIDTAFEVPTPNAVQMRSIVDSPKRFLVGARTAATPWLAGGC
jgi:hypothetical protein